MRPVTATTPQEFLDENAESFDVLLRNAAKVYPAYAESLRNHDDFDFDDLLIDGEFRKPATLYTRALKSPRFERLLRLQKSFLPQLFQTARYPSLRWFR